MTRYVPRQFAIGSEESLMCEMRLEEHEGETLVVLREGGHPRLRGALTARFEYVANLVTIELAMRGERGRSVRFFQEHHGFDNGKVSRPPLVQEVQLNARDGQYHYARWTPLDPATAALLNEASCSQMAEKKTL